MIFGSFKCCKQIRYLQIIGLKTILVLINYEGRYAINPTQPI